jgi:hypothetical protein
MWLRTVKETVTGPKADVPCAALFRNNTINVINVIKVFNILLNAFDA